MHYKKYSFIIIIYLIPIQLLFAQPKFKLIKRWEKISTEQRIDSLLKYVWKYRSKNTNLAFKFGREAIKLSENTDKLGLKAKAFNLVGVLYRNISEYDSSLTFYRKALEFAKISNDSEQLGYAYNNIGGYYGYNQMYFLALDNVLHARSIFENIKNKRGIAFCDVQLALWFNLIKDYSDAQHYAKEAIKIRKELKDEFGIAIAQSILSQSYQGKDECNKAINLANNSLKIFKKFDSKNNQGFVLGNIASIKLKHKEYKEALKLRREAVRLLEESRDKIGLIQNYNGLANAYFHLGKYKLAIKAAQKAIALSKKIKNKISLVTSYRILMQVYAKTHNPSRAIEYSLKYGAELDTVLQKQTETRIHEFHKIMANNLLAQKNIKLTESLKANRIILYFSVIAFLITLILIIIIVIQNKKLRLKSNILSNTVASKDKLFGVIAHDLKNPFNTLLGYTDMVLNDFDDFSKAEIKEIFFHLREVSQKLFDMVENLLQWAISQTGNLKCEPEYFKLDDLIKKTIAYLQEHANSKKIEITTNFSDNLVCFADVKMIETALRNLLSNAIKFTHKKGKISISAKNIGDFIELKIADTGIGLTKEEISRLFAPKKDIRTGTSGETGSGLGLLLVKEFLELNGGKIKEIKSQKNKGTQFTILLPSNAK